MASDLFVHTDPDRQAARERWPWDCDPARELPWPPESSYKVEHYGSVFGELFPLVVTDPTAIAKGVVW